MIFGMSFLVFIHVVISLVAIGAGFVVAAGLLNAQLQGRITALFLAMTALTCISGFIRPASAFQPSHATGIVTMVVFAVAAYARYSRHLIGAWRWIYAVAAVLCLYLNVFVLVVQLFLKVPALKALAPTGAEPPFQIAQAIVLALFALLTIVAARKFRPEPRLA
jgi:hypothetical protein